MLYCRFSFSPVYWPEWAHLDFPVVCDLKLYFCTTDNSSREAKSKEQFRKMCWEISQNFLFGGSQITRLLKDDTQKNVFSNQNWEYMPIIITNMGSSSWVNIK